MKSVAILMVLSTLLVQRCTADSDCAPGYAAMMPPSTMCMTDSTEVKVAGVSEEDKALILDYHNDKRRTVNPPGRDLFKLVWDDEIAKVAQKWANQCIQAHDANRNVYQYPGIHIGQNYAAGHGSWEKAMHGWWSEVDLFSYGKQNVLKKVGHYTQVVSNIAYRIGCGFAKCGKNLSPKYVCNYAVGQMNFNEPYEQGDQCSACPDNCKDGLCDCGGKMCLNGGDLDINSCICTCRGLYAGNNCEILNCPAEDDYKCELYYSEYCEYSNVQEMCVYMCDVPACRKEGKEDCGDIVCKHEGVLDGETCKCDCGPGFVGEFCEIELPPCDGKTCQNDGALNEDTCGCECIVGYDGDLCQNKLPTCEKFCQNDGALNEETCSCECIPGYDGDLCQNKKPVCSGKTCDNDGQLDEETCVCKCYPGYDGDLCQNKLPPCDGKTCQNDGNLNEETCECRCPPEFVGLVCEEKLPPCDNKVCQNDGNLDVKTCECECAPEYRGDFCEDKKPPCGGNICENYGTLNVDECVCECHKGYSGTWCEIAPNEKANHKVCWTGGVKLPTEQCQRFGDNGHDTSWCESKGNDYFNCSACTIYSNVNKSYCPVMCGKCEVPCDDMKCLNGGTLKSTCKCDCNTNYKGDRCEIPDCPEKDETFCEDWPQSYCETYPHQVPNWCPYKCGFCPSGTRDLMKPGL